jgi:hypothetical protein
MAGMPTPLTYPPQHYFVKSQSFEFAGSVYVVTCETDIALHLGLFITSQTPHHAARNTPRRGVPYARDLHFVFNTESFYEQDEAGDTLTHTWTIPQDELGGMLFYRFVGMYLDRIYCPVCETATLTPWRAWTRRDSTWFRVTKLICTACQWRGEFAAAHHTWLPVSISPAFITTVPFPEFIELCHEAWDTDALHALRLSDAWQAATPPYNVIFLDLWSN